MEDDAEDQHPSKEVKSEESASVDHIKALIESNRHLASQIETLTNITTHQVQSLVAQSVGFNQNHPQYDKGGYQKQDSNEKAKENKPVLGKTQDPIATKGKHGSLNITDTCNYCKNLGHVLSNCKKLDDRIQRGLARPIHLTQEFGKIDRVRGMDLKPGPTQKQDPQFIPKSKYTKEDIDCLFLTVSTNTISEEDKILILEQAVTPCPETKITIKETQILFWILSQWSP